MGGEGSGRGKRTDTWCRRMLEDVSKDGRRGAGTGYLATT